MHRGSCAQNINRRAQFPWTLAKARWRLSAATAALGPLAWGPRAWEQEDKAAPLVEGEGQRTQDAFDELPGTIQHLGGTGLTSDTGNRVSVFGVASASGFVSGSMIVCVPLCCAVCVQLFICMFFNNISNI